jgi:hypothetical protein
MNKQFYSYHWRSGWRGSSLLEYTTFTGHIVTDCTVENDTLIVRQAEFISFILN